MIGQGMHGFVENKELVIPDIDAVAAGTYG
jgi:hypothetical protein